VAIRKDTDELIAFLNSLVAIDHYAIAELLATRVPCNEALAAHQSVQVAGAGKDVAYIAPGTFRVGILGILNGYCGTIDDGPRKNWGPITAVYDNGMLVRFERTPTDVTEVAA
jgi:uncharacterized membrane protein